MQTTLIPRFVLTLLATSLSLATPAVWAHGDAAAKKDKIATVSTEEHAFGKPGDPKQAARTITLDMDDTMRFTPSEISVKQGETIRFVIRNKGKLPHEMVLGTLEGLQHHGQQMQKHPGMKHDAPYMAHVAPGGKEEMLWQFSKLGNFKYGCLEPGHFEAGMLGNVNVVKAKP